jgi:hypothetical protein
MYATTWLLEEVDDYYQSAMVFIAQILPCIEGIDDMISIAMVGGRLSSRSWSSFLFLRQA